MKRTIRSIAILLFIILGPAFSGYGQSVTVTGLIVDAKTGESLPGATIFIEGTIKGAAADMDGRFVIAQAPAGRQTLVASYVSYSNKRIEGLTLKPGATVDVTVTLDPAEGQALNEVEVVARLNYENNAALALKQKNAGSLSDGISAETIRRTPDRNTSDVLKRVSGVTIQDDKFIVVRGLNERYNAAYLNGAPLPSTEPDRKAFAFDLFPSNMIENIVVYKTATPDLPGEFAGGIVQVNTRSMPEKSFVSISASSGYNSITTGREKITYEGGRFDRLGFDDGSRDLPGAVPALSEKRSWIGNEDQARIGKEFSNDWATRQAKFAPNTGFQLSGGYNVKRKDKEFFGVMYSLGNTISHSRYSFLRSEYDNMDISGKNPAEVTVQKEREYNSEVYQTQASSGALLNLSLRMNGNNSIGLKNLLCGNSDDRFISAVGSNNLVEKEGSINKVNTRYFSANRIVSSQLTGDHLLGASKIKVEWNAGYSDISRTVPNLRYTSYSRLAGFREFDPSEGPNVRDTMYRADIGPTSGPNYAGYRVYSSLDETIVSGKLDVSKSIVISERHRLLIRSGFSAQLRERAFAIRQFGVQPYRTNDSLYYLPEDKIFEQQNMGSGGFKMFELTKDDDNYRAGSRLSGAYLMGEYQYAGKLRLIGGLRRENYAQQLRVQYPLIDSTLIDNAVTDLLPSVNLIVNLGEKAAIRAAWSKTLNRPEFRELALTSWFDPETRLSLAGNPALERSFIRNYDLRFEVYPGRGQLATVTSFYKYFHRPIERYLYRNNENLIYYSNANSGKIYGLELEYRINLGSILRKDSVRWLANTSIFSNLSLMKSEVDVSGINEVVPETRPMQGQAPYIINTGASYVDKKRHFSLTVAYNRVGPRIYLVGNNWLPNRWENGRNVLDLQFTRSFMKDRLEFRINVKDILQNDWVVYYKGSDRRSNAYDKDSDYVNLKRNYGSTCTFAITLKF